MALTRVSPALFATSNNITSVTVGGSANTISLTFDASGVITSATNNAVSVANTAITGNIISSQISPSVTLTTPIISGNLNLDSAGTTGIRVPSANTITFHTAGTEDMRIDSSGRLLVGSTFAYDSATFCVTSAVGQNRIIGFDGGGSGARGRFFVDAPAASQINLVVDGAGTMGFVQNATEMARFDSNRNLLVGCTSLPGGGTTGTAFQLGASISGMCTWTNRSSTTAASEHAYFYNPNGIVGFIRTTGSATAYSTSSDYRLKENIAPMTGALAKVALLKPVTYKWKVDGSDGEGFIAHELAEVVPECVSGDKDAVDADGNPKYQGIDTSFLVATLTAAIQELKSINDTQTTSIATLTATATSQAATITALTARVVALES